MDKKSFFDRIRAVFGVEDPAGVARYCKERWPEETAHVLWRAEDACANLFLFDFRWDMERTWDPVSFSGEIDWSAIPFGDREFLWQFNRHRFLLCLGQAYLLTGEEKYAFHHIRLLNDWMERAQEGENPGLGPWRTLETGLRAEVWLRSLCMVENSEAVTDKVVGQVEACMRKHALRLEENFSMHKYLSNWGVLESAGLLLFSVAAAGEERARWEKTALSRLSHAAVTQVLEDGTQWEQSPMYHNEVYQCFRSALYYGERAGIAMPEEIRSAVRKMAYVDGIWKKPDHTQFTQGDSDASDLRDQLTAGAWVLQDPALKFWGYSELDFESAWQFGYGACEEYARMEEKEPEFVSAQLPFSGNYYFRSNWTENGNLLHFHCGDTGGGHGHADKLHVDLVLNGEDVLVDAGRSTYVDGGLRYELKEPAAHNVTLVDQKSFSRCETSWIYKELCSCLKQQFYDGRLGSFVEGSHMGYLDKGILVNRQVIWIKPDIYILADHFYGTGQHTYETLFHFGRQGSLVLEEQKTCFTGEKTVAWLQVVEGRGEEKLHSAKQSLYYNEVGENMALTVSSKAEGSFCRITVLNGGPKETAAPAVVDRLPVWSVVHDRQAPVSDAEGFRIRLKDKEYLLLLCHRELLTPTDILKCENCFGYGKAVLFDRTQEKTEPAPGEILAWW